MKLLVGVDIGTQGTKAALFDGESGECLATATCPSQLHRPAAGVVEEDPERQYESVCRTIRQCMGTARAEKGDVAAIGIDGQMAGIIGVGREGRNVTPYDSWLDSRCAPQMKEMADRCGDRILQKTGSAPGFNHGPKKLWWKQTKPKVFAKVAAFVQPGGYAAMRLCGLSAADAFIDQTYLHFSGFADNVAGAWDAGLCDTLGMDGSKLPRIVEPQTVIGAVTKDAAKACGLSAGVPVVAGCGDTAASFLACGATRVGVCVDVAGTASVFAATTDSFGADSKNKTLACGRSATPGLWHPYAYLNGGGMNLEWFRRDIAGASASRKNSKVRPAIDFAGLEQLAARVEVDDRLPFFIPHLGGRSCPSQPHLRGAWLGLAWDHSLAHLYRSILESVALEYGAYQQILCQMYPQLVLKEMRITGGGEKSPLWNQIKSDVLQLPVARIEKSEGAPRGVAMLAGFGVGILRNLDSAARRWIRPVRAARPEKRRKNYYCSRVERYRAHLKAFEDCLLAAAAAGAGM